MDSWIVNLLSALGGAIIALIGREIINWYKRPRIVIAFEERIGTDSHTADFSLGELVMGIESKARFLRLVAQNRGKRPALNCEAKVVVTLEEDGDTAIQLLHWARRDLKLYSTLDQIYIPIHLNSKDKEIFDVLELDYGVDIDKQKYKELSPNACIETVSPYSILIERNKKYFLEATIYANNTTSKPFRLLLNWDGTIDGFNKAFTKI